MPDPFDPAPFRRATRLQRLIEAVESGRDPDEGADPETRALHEETRALLAVRLPDSPTVEEEDARIVACYREARRRIKRRQAGRTWGE